MFYSLLFQRFPVITKTIFYKIPMKNITAPDTDTPDVNPDRIIAIRPYPEKIKFQRSIRERVFQVIRSAEIDIEHTLEADTSDEDILNFLRKNYEGHGFLIPFNPVKVVSQQGIDGVDIAELIHQRLGATIPFIADAPILMPASVHSFGAPGKIKEASDDIRRRILLVEERSLASDVGRSTIVRGIKKRFGDFRLKKKTPSNEEA